MLEGNRERGVHVQAWAPLGGSTGGLGKGVKEACAAIGAPYGKSAQQVALRWIVQVPSPPLRGPLLPRGPPAWVGPRP